MTILRWKKAVGMSLLILELQSRRGVGKSRACSPDKPNYIQASPEPKKAATLLDIDQPKVSALMRGRLSGFSTERLFKFLNDLGRDVEIVVKPKPRSRHRAKISI
jgi:hypothetical protein